MKILLVNGSPRKNKETFASLEIIRKILNENGVETTYFHLGNQPYRGCLHCDQCAKTSYCFNNEDECNLLIDLIKECDGVIIGTPVYFAGPNGALCALLDRVFYAASNYGYHFKGKLASGVATCWRILEHEI
jgi:multimeric flavodoxin WrbA